MPSIRKDASSKNIKKVKKVPKGSSRKSTKKDERVIKKRKTNKGKKVTKPKKQIAKPKVITKRKTKHEEAQEKSAFSLGVLDVVSIQWEYTVFIFLNTNEIR